MDSTDTTSGSASNTPSGHTVHTVEVSAVGDRLWAGTEPGETPLSGADLRILTHVLRALGGAGEYVFTEGAEAEAVVADGDTLDGVLTGDGYWSIRAEDSASLEDGSISAAVYDAEETVVLR